MIAVSGLQRHYKRFRDADAEARVFLIQRRYIPRLLSFIFLPLRLLLAVLLRAALLALKPVVHIRFGRYNSASLGIWAIPIELHLCEKDAGIHPRRCLDIFYHFNNMRFMLKNAPRPKEQVCNQQLHAMYRRKLRIAQVAATLDGLNRMLPRGSEAFTALSPWAQPYDPWGLFERFPPHVTFAEEEEQYGLAGLRDLGIEPDARFVCFNARDGAYVFENQPRMVSLYGDWVLETSRNASIVNYLPAADKLTACGYYAIRMGKWVNDALQHDNPRVIDYATKYHSDFMDVFLSARCAFFIGQNSGMTSLPAIFRRPMALVNIMPLGEISYAAFPDTIFIPKKYYSAKQRRLLTFREILCEPRLLRYPGKSCDDSQAYYDSIGLEIQENSPQEITELAMELEGRLRGIFKPSAEDETLQRRFSEIISAYRDRLPPLEDPQRLRIGSHFLRAHPELLE